MTRRKGSRTGVTKGNAIGQVSAAYVMYLLRRDGVSLNQDLPRKIDELAQAMGMERDAVASAARTLLTKLVHELCLATAPEPEPAPQTIRSIGLHDILRMAGKAFTPLMKERAAAEGTDASESLYDVIRNLMPGESIVKKNADRKPKRGKKKPKSRRIHHKHKKWAHTTHQMLSKHEHSRSRR